MASKRRSKPKIVLKGSLSKEVWNMKVKKVKKSA